MRMKVVKPRPLDQAIDPYRVEVSIKNNLLLSAIEAAGYRSQSSFARACGIHQSRLSALILMRKAPISSCSGEFSPEAKSIMEVLGACPSDLWTDTQLYMEIDEHLLKRNRTYTFSERYFQVQKASGLDALILPDPCIEAENTDRRAKLKLAIQKIRETKPRVALVLEARYGLGNDRERTLEEIGKMLDVTRGRVQQLEFQGLQMLRKESQRVIRELE